MIEQPTASTGLAAMTGGAAENSGGHLVLADWLEEHLDRADVAAVLRLSEEDPRTEPEDAERTDFSGFRYEFLDADVVLYMNHWHVWRYYKSGQKPEQLEGHVVGMCVRGGVPGGPLAWARWLPSKGKSVGEVQALWDRLGTNLPTLPEE